ncbi:hypothetical protein Psesu_1962 [Pseudoxanthomonas suwonensis 11-1]|uniref:LiaI-LiaF-like transmembrane region domain-containing protein n=1 Tax=Pseudoxanthomonas suwonensis (strain 11-1) TaxID=743721 RepID=E6WU79_PSEUU|nr:DUF5668 domain-containing protein [Pseudoxanthomonas suwonensis]ADV27799.1 hypothetical protein Psesu_1962 [Pseudoxanthomonas suwonensis 11-1]
MHRRLIPALVLIVLGTLFLLDNLGVGLDAGRLLATWWPLLLIAAGLSRLLPLAPRREDARAG